MFGGFYFAQPYFADGPGSAGFIIPGLLLHKRHMGIAPREPLPVYIW